MSTKINFSQQVVAITTAFSFSDMGTLQTMLEGTAIEALEKEDHDSLKNVKSIAEKFGIEIDLDFDTPVKVSASGVQSVPSTSGGDTNEHIMLFGSTAKLEEGEKLPRGLTEADLNDDNESED